MVHVIISIVVAIAAVGLGFFVWYPAPLHTAVAVTGIFLLLLMIVVCLGPLLTAVIYKKGKTTLRIDLAVIATL